MQSSELANLHGGVWISHLRSNVKRRHKELTEEAKALMKRTEGTEKERLQGLLDDCRTILDIVEGGKEVSTEDLWEIYGRYASERGPNKGETATLWYKMRLFALRFWDRSSRILKQHESSERT